LSKPSSALTASGSMPEKYFGVTSACTSASGVALTKAIARWIAERAGKELAADGSLTLEHPLADEHWLVRHVLQYGADAEVIDPPEGRAAVRERLRAIVDRG